MLQTTQQNHQFKTLSAQYDPIFDRHLLWHSCHYRFTHFFCQFLFSSCFHLIRYKFTCFNKNHRNQSNSCVFFFSIVLRQLVGEKIVVCRILCEITIARCILPYPHFDEEGGRFWRAWSMCMFPQILLKCRKWIIYYIRQMQILHNRQSYANSWITASYTIAYCGITIALSWLHSHFGSIPM